MKGLSNAVTLGGGDGGGTLALISAATLPEVALRTVCVVTPETVTDILMQMITPTHSAGRVWVEVTQYGEQGTISNGGGVMLKLGQAWRSDGTDWVPVDAYYALWSEWVHFSHAYVELGVEWNYAATSPILTRIGDAVGLTASAGVGVVEGSSGFDTMPIYKDIRTCNVANDGTVNAYEGDTGFTRNGTNGEVMIEIPVGYIKVENDTANSKLRMYICHAPKTGYTKHAAGQHNGGTQDVIYIGAYKTSASYHSKSGVAPLVSETRATTRAGVKAGRGNNRWSMVDMAARQYVALLMMIEYATLDLQGAIGQGVTAASAARNAGDTDGIAYHTGREAGTDNLVSCRWRGLEDWWGNVWEWIDGFNFNGGTLYHCLNQDNFADDTATSYTALSYAVGTALSATYGIRLGYDAAAPWSLLPSAHSGGSSATYLCDACWSSTGWRVARAGGTWLDGSACGAFAWSWNGASSFAGANVGSRLLYIPLGGS